ncbi:hypothetical protein PUN28_013672 [Cardiocondyla obscurior]|uniref:Uncharacterized protein n=1 Tax=Cardiocondyla obscurior TaxID=286306 RepID=A0AAW2F431_9HYME
MQFRNNYLMTLTQTPAAPLPVQGMPICFELLTYAISPHRSRLQNRKRRRRARSGFITRT